MAAITATNTIKFELFDWQKTADELNVQGYAILKSLGTHVTQFLTYTSKINYSANA